MSNQRNATQHFDVVIIGGGPGGTAAGITLLKRDGTSVAIVESSDYSAHRIGESLTPGVRPLLEYLDVWEPFTAQQSLESFGSQAAWGSPELHGLDYMFTLHGTGWGLDRLRFDTMLANIFQERGGTLFTNTRFQACERTAENQWTVQVRDQERNVWNIHSSYLIDATGRSGHVAKELRTTRTVHDQLVGVGRIAQLSNNCAVESVIMVEACEYGWWYTAPIPGNRMSVVLMSDADIVSQMQAARLEVWQRLLNNMVLTRQRVADAEFTEKPRSFSCLSSCLRQVGGNNWVAVGDAAASHDPLSSSGIPHAIGSGVQGALVAANALYADGRMLESYQHSIHTDFQQYQRTHWGYYRRENRWPQSTFWKRRTTPIAIDPHATVQCTRSVNSATQYNPVHLSAEVAWQLYRVCTSGTPVHQLVRAVVDEHPHIPDQHVILGFQELVDNGLVEIESVGYSTT